MSEGKQALEQPLKRKKVYRRPNLTRYGDLTEITQSFGNMGNIDNAIVGHNHKTG